ncbi:glycosyltransferase [Novosphingobium sp. TH158]|uniref:glycosyltransferase n=1 Tax=Novosphingobium sp. TH158 TaxID=2067455 RepID=UPI000C7DF668|nr:glycosyltransferase [Novosphingobium sp. TH158]PLK26602.1 glycosyl transferase family 2 [Novosphingobium sp. TH158]
MSSPIISVAMSVFNGERFLAEAIESVLAQTLGDFELLILDDGSRDSTPGIISDYAKRDSRIRPIIRENRGLIASLNQLVYESRAPLVARMDADDVCLPQRFARQAAFLDAHPDHGVLGTWCEDIDENGRPWPVASAHRHPVDHESFLAAIPLDRPLLCHPSVMFRRELVLAVGGYHSAFKHCEDLDLWLRLASRTRLSSLPEQLIKYRHYSDQVSSRHATQQQIGAAVARIAYGERLAGRSDPTADLDSLPPLDELDALFGREGISRAVRAEVAPGVLYSQSGLRGDGFDLILRYLRDGGAHDGMWRTVLRLMRIGEMGRALRLASTLATARVPG